MTEILIGTSNPAKVRQFRCALAPAGITVKNLTELIDLPGVAEDALDCRGNARKKAAVFAMAAGARVLAVDAALFFPGLAADVQPGVHVRRIDRQDRYVSDQEVLAHYSALCDASGGGQLEANWHIAVAVAEPHGACAADVIEVRRTLRAPPSPARRDGFPLDSLQVDPETGRYLAELTADEEDELWQRTIGIPAARFIEGLRREDDSATPGAKAVNR